MASLEKVGILGGGQLGRQLVEAANQLNIQVIILEKGNNAPAKQVNARDDHIDGSFTDKASIQKLANSCDILTVEIEHVDTKVLEEVSRSSTIKIEPSWKTIRIIQDKFQQKRHLSRHSIPMAKYRELGSTDEEILDATGQYLGYPFMLKSKTQAYDGRGNYAVKSSADLPRALEALKDRPLYAEKWADFKMELAVMVVKTKNDVLSFSTVETVHEDSICKLVYAPPRDISEAVNQAAQKLARETVGAFEGKGVFGVEMFLLEDETLLVNEVAPRVHNSGHHTIEACGMSQFEAHLRAILDLPIPEESLELRQPAIMLNILGGSSLDSHLAVAKSALSIPNASIHLYSKGDSRPGRKMGHITVAGNSMQEAESHIEPLIDLVNKIRAARTDVPLPAPEISRFKSWTPPPVVAVIMGSKSDMPTLEPGLKLLEEQFGIKPEVDIISAHRTPRRMVEYAGKAKSRGIQVIIAAAGGAAHLPGMVAACTPLPVVGVPVKSSFLNGLDSLLSIVQMPRGVPVGTMGSGNSINAAIYAARIVGLKDKEVEKRVDQYQQNMEAGVEEDRENLLQSGWRSFLNTMGS